ncbi:MAG: hypothetical protein U5J62_05680 [Desulfurivibrio sp.]|nr:hypothetical protein [Desulfurivibrio sp.]
MENDTLTWRSLMVMMPEMAMALSYSEELNFNGMIQVITLYWESIHNA